jgi:predicted aspartyl protease
MGRIVTEVSIENIVEPGHEMRCDALVDTGVYCLTLPAAWKARLGSLPMSRTVKLETADSRVVEGEICGPVRIRIAGFDAVAGEVIFMPVSPGGGPCEPLLGYITLEQSGLVVDLLGHRLVRVPALDLKRARAAA